MINDIHCHFFSPTFFTALAKQRGRSESADDLCHELHWEPPVTPEALADRWVLELDRQGVQRAAVIASIAGDEGSVAAALRRHPTRFVGFFMVDPASTGVVERVQHAVGELGLRGICLFPAMHHVPLDDERVERVVEVASQHHGAAVFVHCGLLTVGVRRKLGLGSRFDLRLGDPLAVARLALAFPNLPFIIPHFGAGLFREALMAAEVCPNIYFDTSSSNSWIRHTAGLTLNAVFRTALDVVGPTRLLFGTDSSFFPRGWQRGIYDEQTAALRRLALDASDQDQILGGNFDRLFR